MILPVQVVAYFRAMVSYLEIVTNLGSYKRRCPFYLNMGIYPHQASRLVMFT